MHWVDPQALPVTNGTIERFVVNHHGELDGLLFSDDREVHVPPHLGRKLARYGRLGAPLALRGLKPRGSDMLVAVSFGGPAGLAVLDEGPEHGKPKRKPAGAAKPAVATKVEGRVVRLLHGARGEVHGALLDSAVQVRWKKHLRDEAARKLAVGDWLVVEGAQRTVAATRVVEAERYSRRRKPRA